MPPRLPPLVFLLLVNLPIALAQYCVLTVYSSHETSGLQYLALFFPGLLAFVALLVLAVEHARAPRVYIVLAASALATACLPQWTDLGYDGAVLDEPGALAATTLLWVQASALAHDLWRRARVSDWSRLGSRVSGRRKLNARRRSNEKSARRD